MPDRPPTPTTLVLVPTAGEQGALADLGGLGPRVLAVELCGLGPVAAAARTAELLARFRPARALLLGIAGSFDLERGAVGTAAAFGEVLIDGVGVGQGTDFQAASRMGFRQWPGPPQIEERLRLAGGGTHALLTVCATSADGSEAAARRARYPRALAEDMEGFGVALACALAAVPLCVVRGFSNAVGARERGEWRIREALAAARALALERLDRSGWDGPDGGA